MTRGETALVIAKIIAYDGRQAKTDEEAQRLQLDAWHEVIGGFTLRDCLAAVALFYREHAEWIMPAHIYERVSWVREARLRAAPPPDIPAAVADRYPRQYAALYAAAQAAIMNGENPAPVIAAGVAALPREIPGGR